MTSDEQKRHIHQALTFLHPEEGTVFEICGLGPSKPKSSSVWTGYAGGKKAVVAGWYNNLIKATEAAAALDDVGCEGIYATLNAVDPALLGRASNRLQAGVAKTQDKEVPILRRFPIDIDPKRAAGTSSTDEEHQAALDHAIWLRNGLSSKGWPEPLYGDSGNGAHLIYQLPDLENTEENVKLIRDALNALNDLYRVAVLSSQGYIINLAIDCTVFNPARIIKLYGTHARKGDNIPDRPHRQAHVIDLPKEPQPVAIELLKALIESAQKDDPQEKPGPNPNQGRSGVKFDLAGYLAHYEVPVKTVKQHGGATLYVLETCLFDSSHTGGEAAIGQNADGALFCFCYHNSCRGHTWADARQKISGADHLGKFMEGYTPFQGQGSPSEQTTDEDFSLKEWPILPKEALSGIAGDFVELATRHSEADPAAVLATFLVRVGIEFGTGPHLMIGDSRHCARLNAIIVGNSSKSRKGTSGKPVSRLFNSLTSLNSQHISAREVPGPLSSGEGLVYAVRDPVMTWHIDKTTKKGEWITSDPGVEDKRLFVLDEELASALQCTKREGNTLSTVIRSAFDNGHISPLTKSNRIEATGAHIGIVSHITTAELHRLLDETQSLNGFANRFLWICARRQKLVPVPEPMASAELRKIQRELLKIFTAIQSIGLVSLSAAARDYWIDAYPEVSEDKPGLVGCIVNRSEAIVQRSALIYALLDAGGTIELRHLESALSMWAYAKESAEYIFISREANPIVQKILDACEQGPVSLTDIHKLLSNHATKTQMQAAIQELLASGKVEVRDEETPGRHKKIISLAKKAKEAKKGYPLGSEEGLNSHNSHNSQRRNENEPVNDSESFDSGEPEIDFDEGAL